MNKNVCHYAALALICGVAQAQTISSGTGVLIGVHTCTDAGCTNANPRYAFSQPALPGDAFSSTSLTGSPGNSGTAAATLGSAMADGAPILKVSGTSTSANWNEATALALQSYTWNGAGSATRTFGGTLTFSQTVGPFGGNVPAGVIAEINVFTLPQGELFNAGTTAADNINALFDPSTQAGYASLGLDQYSNSTSITHGTGNVDVTLTLQQGVTYWVWASLLAGATNGGAVDASHTFVTAWNNSAGLTPAATVPEPGTGALFGLGLATLGFMRRKRQGDKDACSRPASSQVTSTSRP